MNRSRISLIVSAGLVALGLAAAGYFVGEGISDRGAGRRIISVKGLSEREVPASVATWTIGYSATGNDLAEINRKLAESTKAIVAFLKEAGFSETDMAVQPPVLRDTSMDVREKDSPRRQNDTGPTNPFCCALRKSTRSSRRLLPLRISWSAVFFCRVNPNRTTFSTRSMKSSPR